MALNIIQYDDYLGGVTTIGWFPVGISTIQDYIDRVLADGGTIEAEQCLRDRIAELEGETYEFCGGSEPLRYRWYGDRYETLRGSTVAINVMIRSDEDKAQIDKTLEAAHYVWVEKDSVIQWRGKIFPQLFTEAYRQYPYVIQLMGTDQVGQLKDYRFLMTDFPEPFNTIAPEFTVLDVLNIALSNPTFKPDADYPTAPEKINISTRLTFDEANRNRTLELTYLDPQNFIDDNDQYMSKWDVLDAILKPLQLYLVQWLGQWWVLSWDALWDNGNFEFVQYTLDFDAGPQYVFTGGYTGGVLDLYDGWQTSDPQQVYNNAQLEYLPAWQGVDYSMTYTPNKQALPIFSNQSGDFYRGRGGTPLEFESAGIGGWLGLRHWNMEGLECTYYPNENSGNLLINSVSVQGDQRKATVTHNIPQSIDSACRAFDVGWTYFYTTYLDSTWIVNIRYTKQGVSRWAYLEGGNFKWNDEPDSIAVLMLGDRQPETVNFRLERPLDEFTGDSELYIEIFQPISFGVGGQAVVNRFRLGFIVPEWEGAGYKDETLLDFVQVNVWGSQPPQQMDFTWGMANSQRDNSHYFHLSSPYTRDGIVKTLWGMDGKTTNITEHKYLHSWLLDRLIEDNDLITRKLKASYRSTQISPLRLVFDYEANIYGFVAGEYNDKSCFWENVEYVEYKSVRNVPGRKDRCDFSVNQFDDSFCKWIIP